MTVIAALVFFAAGTLAAVGAFLVAWDYLVVFGISEGPLAWLAWLGRSITDILSDPR